MNESTLSRPDGISVVVCTHNGKERLEATLQSIFQQKTTNELAWEILVIDNASTDGTKDCCIAAGAVGNVLVSKIDFAKLVSHSETANTETFFCLGEDNVSESGNNTVIVVSFIF